MSTFIVVIHVIVAIALILIVLLQTGKGADMGAVFGGGGGQTLFGATGASTFLSRLTTIAAIVFMLTSLGLAYLSSHQSGKSVTSEMAPPAVPQTEQAPLTTPAEGDGAPVEAPVQSEAVPAEGAPAPPVTEEAGTPAAAPEPAGEEKSVAEPES